jgi:hypothetical protein
MSSAFHKSALFIDGLNLHFTAKALGFDIDFKRLLAEFARRGKSWSRLSEQNLRIDKWRVCRG